jgi:hypothetical protein
MTRSSVPLRDPCDSCLATEGCWNYGYDANGNLKSWFDCENAAGPHNAPTQPLDIRKCAHVTGFTPPYIHMTHPIGVIEGADAILAHERDASVHPPSHRVDAGVLEVVCRS